MDPTVDGAPPGINAGHHQAGFVGNLGKESVGVVPAVGEHSRAQPKRMDDGHVRAELLVDVDANTIVGIQRYEAAVPSSYSGLGPPLHHHLLCHVRHRHQVCAPGDTSRYDSRHLRW